ncbi:MAG: electron transfer flavoprotein subunit beta/FixA family protein [Thermoanaerobacteraceae bacterium]|nr:electron transfer flavoprotein subunit beta/FixA family protein [Thermoanaerobacteraceae bacterium]
MNIIVLIKQVPDTNEVRIDPETKTLIRQGVPSIVNPEDKNAIEEALRLKETVGGKVTVVTMGPPQADVALREAMAMGVDESYLLTDRFFAGADTYATAKTLSTAIRHLFPDFDIVLCGRQAIDGDTAQVGPQTAEQLGIPQVTYVSRIEVNDTRLLVSRVIEDGYEVIEVGMPALLTIVKEANKPRYPSIKRIFEAYNAEVRSVGINDLGLDGNEVGLKGSPTKVVSTETPDTHRSGEVFSGNPKECADLLIQRLKIRHLI